MNNQYKKQLADKIRSFVLNNAKEDVFPLSQLEVINFEFGEKPESDYVIVVQKSQSQIGGSSVSKELFEEHLATGKDLNEIIQEKKNQGDQRYLSVTGAVKRKAFYECILDMFVNYSLEQTGS